MRATPNTMIKWTGQGLLWIERTQKNFLGFQLKTVLCRGILLQKNKTYTNRMNSFIFTVPWYSYQKIIPTQNSSGDSFYRFPLFQPLKDSTCHDILFMHVFFLLFDHYVPKKLSIA
jgi:hypothetical protein